MNIVNTLPTIAPGPRAFPGVFESLADELGAEKLAELRQAQKEHDAIYAKVAEVDNNAARRTIERLQKDYAADPSEKNFKQLRQTADSRDSLHAKNLQIRRTIRRTLREFCSDRVYPLVRPIFIRASQVLEPYADELENQEKAAFQFADVPFKASDALRAMRYQIQSLKDRAEQMRSGDRGEFSPRQLLAGIIEF